MTRYLCVHGHFYQPPRENPWLESVEIQDSARPYHDWNARIDAECYARNAAARILGPDGAIERIVDNYERISFDFGPTLLAWLETGAPSTYAAVLDADRRSAARCSGHGSAMAQAYNHSILPLASERDRRTQVLWGLRDFEHRFGRRAEGMWLPETAVDDATLDLLAECGVAFTVLAPAQAKEQRPLGDGAWQPVSDGSIDPSRAYLRRLPSGREIALFFYDGPISRAVAFEGLLHRGERFAERLTGGLSSQRDWPQLMHIATDGESYGHHHRHGEMALAFALDHVERNGLAALTNYGEFLARHPPRHEVTIHERTAWSCMHGLGRWERDCGCNSGGRPEWNQRWRAPLRQALDFLRDRLAVLYEREAAPLLRDPWAARDAYIELILERSPERATAWLEQHGVAPVASEPAARSRARELLEMQRHAQLMYTSCGWFFDEISGIETVQVLRYAGRAIQLAEAGGESDLEPTFVELLAAAKSNLRAQGDGRRIYERHVRRARVDLLRVGAHHAVRSLFDDDEADATRVYCYEVRRERHDARRTGEARLVTGAATVTSRITGASAPFTYAGVHFGDHNVAVGVQDARATGDARPPSEELAAAFARADMPEVVRLLEQQFPGRTFSLRSLFRDEQVRIVQRLLEQSVQGAYEAYRQIHSRSAGLMRLLAEDGIRVPRPLEVAAELGLQHRLETALGQAALEPDAIGELLAEAEQSNLRLDEATLAYAFRVRLDALAPRIPELAADATVLTQLEAAAAIASRLPFDVDADRLQNALHAWLTRESGGPDRERVAAAAQQLGLRTGR